MKESVMFNALTSIYHTNPKEFRRFAKFSIVGALGAVIDFAVLNLMAGVFGWPLLWANTLSVVMAILSNFTWNRLWTFPESRTRKKRTQLPQFFIVNLIGLVINNIIVLAVYAVVNPYTGDFLARNIAKAAAIGVVLFWNFGANRLWTYRGL